MVVNLLDFEIENDIIRCIEHLPSGEDKGVGVVFCYGFIGSRVDVHRMLPKASRIFASVGIPSIRFDYRGFGVSDGCLNTVTPVRQVADVIHVVNSWLKNHPNLRHVVLLGFSHGCSIACRASEYLSSVCGLVLWSPHLSINRPFLTLHRKARLLEMRKELHEFKTLQIPFYHSLTRTHGDSLGRKGYRLHQGQWICREYFDQRDDRKDVHALSKKQYPGLLIVGGKDWPLCDHRYQAGICRLFSSLRIHIVPGAYHLFCSAKEEQEVLEVTRNWLVSNSF